MRAGCYEIFPFLATHNLPNTNLVQPSWRLDFNDPSLQHIYATSHSSVLTPRLCSSWPARLILPPCSTPSPSAPLPNLSIPSQILNLSVPNGFLGRPAVLVALLLITVVLGAFSCPFQEGSTPNIPCQAASLPVAAAAVTPAVTKAKCHLRLNLSSPCKRATPRTLRTCGRCWRDKRSNCRR